MKPSKSKHIDEVLRLSASLPQITVEEKAEAMRYYATIYAGKKTAWCSCCGLEWSADLWDNKRIKKAVCPYCRTKGTVKRSAQKTVHEDKWYFSLVQMVEGWQVERAFFCEIYTRKGDAGSPLRWFIKEVSQCWMIPDIEPIFLGRAVRGACCGACDLWRWDTDIKLKYDHYRYRISTAFAKKIQLHPQIKRNGFKSLLPGGWEVVRQLEKMMNDPRAEILVKTKQTEMLKAYMSNSYHVRGYWNEIRIATRHKYKIKNATMWMDIIDQLRELGKDTHNPHYICPENLKQTHDRLMADVWRRQKEFEKKQKEAERLKLAAATSKYRQRLGKLLDIVVVDEDIVLKPLQTVEDFKQEGDELRHCVFSNKYYEKKDILIIGAKVNGKRTETIELNLKSRKILQCRAKSNGVSAYHEDILSLMEQNIQKYCNAVV